MGGLAAGGHLADLPSPAAQSSATSWASIAAARPLSQSCTSSPGTAIAAAAARRGRGRRAAGGTWAARTAGVQRLSKPTGSLRNGLCSRAAGLGTSARSPRSPPKPRLLISQRHAAQPRRSAVARSHVCGGAPGPPGPSKPWRREAAARPPAVLPWGIIRPAGRHGHTRVWPYTGTLARRRCARLGPWATPMPAPSSSLWTPIRPTRTSTSWWVLPFHVVVELRGFASRAG
jgi:hypothetical protein